MPKRKRGGRRGGRVEELLPNSDMLWQSRHSLIPRQKLKDYLLNPHNEPNKSRVFADLGYNMRNWRRLERDLREGLKISEPVYQRNSKTGDILYKVVMELGIGRKRKMRTIWAVRNSNGILHFVTAYPE